jgi:AcrR family transcriptional regulator
MSQLLLNQSINKVMTKRLALVESKRSNSREMLLKSAANLFTERGYSAVSTRDIAEQAGVNLALIQYHFGSKEKLFIATVDHLTDEKSELLHALRPIPKSASPRDGAIELAYFIRTFLAFLLESAQAKSSCRLIYRELFSGGAEDREIYTAVVKFILDRHFVPLEERVISLLRFIAPKQSEIELTIFARSIIGQCSYYATHGPLIACLQETKASCNSSCIKIGEHITQFSLRGIGCDEEMIRAALTAVFDEV